MEYSKSDFASNFLDHSSSHNSPDDIENILNKLKTIHSKLIKDTEDPMEIHKINQVTACGMLMAKKNYGVLDKEDLSNVEYYMGCYCNCQE